MVPLIIAGTVTLIVLYLVLTVNNGGAARDVIGSVGGQYVNIIKALQGKG